MGLPGSVSNPRARKKAAGRPLKPVAAAAANRATPPPSSNSSSPSMRLRRRSLLKRRRNRLRPLQKRALKVDLNPKAAKAAEVKAQAKKKTNLVIAAMSVVAVLATAFWMTLLSPKRQEAD